MVPGDGRSQNPSRGYDVACFAAKREPTHVGIAPKAPFLETRSAHLLTLLLLAMPNATYGTTPHGPLEGQYDVRRGASAYAPIVGSFGALAVTAVVVVFTVPSDENRTSIALATGLLAVGFFGSMLGAFGLAAVGAERDPTANLAAGVTYLSIPVVVSIVSVLGAFEVLASIYVSESAGLFCAITGAGGAFGILMSAFAIADCTGLHPTTMFRAEFDRWLARQWITTRQEAIRTSDVVAATCLAPLVVGFVLRFAFGVEVSLGHNGVNWLIGLGIGLCLAGSIAGLRRTTHPASGNEQVALRWWEAWLPCIAISGYTLGLLLTLP